MSCEQYRHDSEYLSLQAIANAWTGNGGSATNLIAAVAVAAAESGQDRYALSSACALGLWQILFSHATDFGVSILQLYDVRVNAAIAVSLSQDGTDWIDFDTAYAEGEALTVRRHISYPEPGSAAALRIPVVQSLLAGGGGGGGGGGGLQFGPPPPAPAHSSVQPALQPLHEPGFTPYGPPIVYVVGEPFLPDLQRPVERTDGWENFASFYATDVSYLTQIDEYLVDNILD